MGSALVAGHLIWGQSPAKAQAGTQVDVSFNFHIDCDRPLKLTNHAISGSGTYVLSADKNHSVDFQISDYATVRMRLGGPLGRAETIPGGEARLQVTSGNSLTLSWAMPQNTLLFRVKASGKTCTFSPSSQLKSGFKEHTYWSGIRYFYCTPPRNIRTTCKIH